MNTSALEKALKDLGKEWVPVSNDQLSDTELGRRLF